MKKYFFILFQIEIVYVFCQKQFQFEIMNLVKNNFNFVFATLFLTPFLAFSPCKSPKTPIFLARCRANFLPPNGFFSRLRRAYYFNLELLLEIQYQYFKSKKNMFCFWTISTFRIIINFYEILF